MHLVNNVLPFALEPFYKLYSKDSFETDSTNRLMEMWSQPVTLKEFLIGSGHYFDPITGSFYKQVDIGLFKNLYYWGIFGYISVILYQLIQLLPIGKIRIKGQIKTNNLYLFCLFFFLLLMDLKSISMGMNKMAFSIILLVAYFYSNDKKKTLSN